MKALHNTVFLLITLCFLMTNAPLSAAYYDDKLNTVVEGEGDFDGQAYMASRYVPAMRPAVVVGTLLLVAIIVVVLQQSQPSGHGH